MEEGVMGWVMLAIFGALAIGWIGLRLLPWLIVEWANREFHRDENWH
jgi:hypothetical protein